MALTVVRPASLYKNDQKFAECNQAEITIDARRGDLFGAEGFLTLARGALTTQITAQHLIPVGGTNPDFLLDTLLQNDVEVAVPIDGRILRWTMGIQQNTMQYNTEQGTCTGTLRMSGGRPTLI